jgi:DNA-binding transcriptional regulator YdaS (Cro superfamily)
MRNVPKINSFLPDVIHIVGSQAELARRLSELTKHPYTSQHVWNWLNRDKVIPAQVVIPIERITNRQLTRYDMRPDLYPREAA